MRWCSTRRPRPRSRARRRWPTPADVKPGSITCEDVPYPYPVSYLPLTLYGQDVRIAFMDVAPLGHGERPHGGAVSRQQLRRLLFRRTRSTRCARRGSASIVPDQIGYGRSSKPIIPYNFHDMARNTKLILQSLKIDKAMIVGHSMGGMLAARFATQYPGDDRAAGAVQPDRPGRSAATIGRGTARTRATSARSARPIRRIRASIMRYVAHNPAAWTPEFETYTRVRYAWTLSADWPRLAMVQTLISQVQYLDPVVDDWAHIKAPTLVFGGAEDSLPGSAAVFKERMKFIADTIPNGNARGCTCCRASAMCRTWKRRTRRCPPLVAFLKEGLADR